MNPSIVKDNKLIGDFWGGFAAMLVAFPSAIAFGVTIFAVIGPSHAGIGALAGILGTIALGLIASAVGGTNRLITAPCAPAAAVLSAFAIQLVQQGTNPTTIVLMLTVLGLLAGVIQIVLGTAGIGRLIRYIPYPVVSGYLSGVGLIIIGSQIPKLLGAPAGTPWWQATLALEHWQWEGILVGLVTISTTLLAPRVTRLLPAVILGLIMGVGTYFGLALLDQGLLVVEGNRLIIGPLAGDTSGLIQAVTGRWQDLGELRLAEIGHLLIPALTLAVLLSIDTLKTCVVLDAITRSRHDSDRELKAQGLGNIVSACIGGMPGAGQMGATLVNHTSGGQTRVSGMLEGVFALIAFLILSPLITWIPVASLAGILIVVGLRMIDWHSLNLLASSWTRFDFVVIVAVVVTALAFSLIAASAIGIGLAMILFIREQLASTIIRGKGYGNSRFSKQRRSRAEMKILEQQGDQTVIVELQGSLFFGTKDQLYSAVEPELGTCKYFILDLRRVQGVDVSAAQVLIQIRDTLMEREAFLIFTSLPRELPNGRNIAQFFDQMEITTFTSQVQVFPEIEDALEWVEDQILGEDSTMQAEEDPLDLHEMDLFKDRKEETLTALEACLEQRAYQAGETIYDVGEEGDEIFLIRRGSVRVVVPVSGTAGHHIASYGRGDFCGGMSFLDRQVRVTRAIAFTDVDLFVLKRGQFDTLSEEHKRLAVNLLEAIAGVLASRLRYSHMEMAALRS
ncbi:MAG: cyclic nucleotide-binding domain-containing protein [Sphingobacteriia bacterium]|nr:cyclic nucleotide-binding domain-containing protein [Sphingobacteriia bacterium]NCC40463.1 cyclic nucleotide-binding domain-containing protein [Gammaproteobacteria bacterium]